MLDLLAKLYGGYWLVKSRARVVLLLCHNNMHNNFIFIGSIGVAAVTAGPGLTNTVTAVKNAQMAESPILLMGGAAATILKGGFQNYANFVSRVSELTWVWYCCSIFNHVCLLCIMIFCIGLNKYSNVFVGMISDSFFFYCDDYRFVFFFFFFLSVMITDSFFVVCSLFRYSGKVLTVNDMEEQCCTGLM